MLKIHRIVAYLVPAVIAYDRWSLSNSLWMKLHKCHGKCKPKLSEYFQMKRCQLNFARFCVIMALGISQQHFDYLNLLVGSVYRLHVYFHVQIILYHLDIPLPYEDGFSKVKSCFVKVHTTVFVMIMVLMRMICRSLGTVLYSRLW